MRDRREMLLFVVVAALVGWLTLGKVNAGYTRARVPAPGRLPAPELVHPATVRLTGVALADGGQRGTGAFAPPRELLPLDPLALPEPPLPLVDIRLPAIDPGVADPMAYRTSADGFGQLELPEEDLGDVGSADSAAEEASAFSAADPGGGAPGPAVEQASPDDLYDWIVRAGSTRRTYGRLLNADVYGLGSRPGEDITFQQVTVRNGRPLGVPFEIPREDVVEFGLARTFENDYHLRSRALGSGAGSVRARSELALEMLAAADEHDQAVAFAEAEAARAWAASPTDASAARLLATVRAAAGDLEGRMAVFRDAAARGLSDAALLCDHALLARELGLAERAEELVSRAFLVSNTAAEVFLARGLLAADRGDHEAALADFVETSRQRFSPPFVERQERAAALARGRSLLALGRAPEARREAERQLLEAPDDAEALQLQGAALAVEGDWDRAADAFSQALVQRPSSATLLTAAGLVAWQQGDGVGARRLFERARDVEPWKALRPTAALAVLYEDAGRMTRARDLYDEALAVEPDDPETLYRLGRLQRWSGDPDTAHSTLRRALRLGGADVLLLAELGTAALLSDSAPAASGYLREALRLSPGDAQVLWLLGITHLKEGDLLGAVDRLTEAAAAGASGAHGALGVARYRLGDAAAALDHFDEVERAYAGRSDHPQALFAAEQAASIRDNLAKRQWLDTFGRSQLQRGWTERQWDGSPRVLLAGGGVSIAGRMEKPREDERPGIARTVEGRSVVSVEAGMAAGGPGDTRYGLSVTHKQVKGVLGQLPKGRLEIWVDRTGAVRLSALDNFETLVLDGQDTGIRVPPGERVALGIERTDAVNGTFRFLVDGRRVGEPVTLKAMRDLTRNTLHVDIWGEAPPGRQADVLVDLVRIVRLP